MDRGKIIISFAIDKEKGSDGLREANVHMAINSPEEVELPRIAEVLEKTLLSVAKVMIEEHEPKCHHTRKAKQIVEFFTH
jgi:hypothetical protein